MFLRAKATGYVKGEPIEPAEINQIDVNLSRAVDGLNGGSYALTTKLSFGGTGGVEFAGTGSVAWPLVSSRILPRLQELRIGNVRYDAGTGNEPSAVLRADTSGNPIIRTPTASGALQAGSWWLALRPPFNGCRFKDVVIRVAGSGVTSGLAPPKFELIAHAPDAGFSSLSPIVTDGHALNGVDWLSPLETTLTPNVVHTVDLSKYLYFVRVTNPFGMGATGMEVRRVLARFEVTTMEPA